MTFESKRKSHKSLFFTFIDFKKAYDSVDRAKLIEVLIKFKVNPKIIDLIVQMYKADKTTIILGKMKETIEVTCGIRQGCSISTLLFKMVTFCIIEDMLTKGRKYKVGKYEGNSLWLADDATLVASSREDVEENIKILIESGSKYGLNLNKTKTKILHVRGTKDVKEIGGYTVEDEVQYLGVNLGGNGRDIFRAEKRVWIKKAKKKANYVISQIKKALIR